MNDYFHKEVAYTAKIEQKISQIRYAPIWFQK